MTGAVSVIIHENPYNEISFNQPHVNDANQVVHVRILNQRFNQAPLIQEQTMTLEQVENCRINYEKYSAGIFSLRNFYGKIMYLFK
ncbi:MAG: hypothetical protein HWD59_03530 [Coxiellaceae bacterium]|nr:MAG: hypothetical protein HWD59_03530 [Coxiellaceae bacterium]